MRQYFNWKTYLIIGALAIVSASIYYTNQLTTKLAAEERKKVELLVEAIKTLNIATDNIDFTFLSSFISSNTTLPFIITDESGNIIDHNNVDTSRARNTPAFLEKKLEEYKELHPPIISDFGLGQNYVYYGESYLLTQLRYFPYVQLAIVFLFLVVVLIALSTAHRSIQNQVWVGLSKETAHQLGTPLSSIEAWLELLQDNDENREAVAEMKKDVDRLKLVADRFGKVGHAPTLEEEDVVVRLRNMVQYMQKRAPIKVTIGLKTNEEHIPVFISGPLFDWVIENLLRNALDSMEGKGSIEIRVTDHPHHVWIDVCDSGKGIPKHQVKKVFNPGYTTKKRGWGLGLSLARRIIKKYHHGSIFVKQSDVGKGTIFRIILRR